MELANESFMSGDEPFGSILFLDNKIIFKDRNRVKDGDHTRHPEFEIARWASNNLTLEERKKSIVYTSGEHCPMCAAAHGWANLGDIHYASSTKELTKWYIEFKGLRGNVRPLNINEVITNVNTFGPYKELTEEIKNLHKMSIERKK